MNAGPWSDIALKAVVAAAFFFFLQYVILKASFDTSLFWSISLGVGAGLLAWSQARRF
jgi:hypothetical protein